MDARIMKIRKLTALILTAAVILLTALAMATQPTLAVGEDDENDGRGQEITIEVVEDIPAADIEEQEVPLAASADSAAARSTHHTVIVWTLAAVIIAYAAFIVSGMRIRRSRRQLQAGTVGDRGDGAGGGKR